ncbi:MAG TPA: cobyrinate a,c-diamide synthase [Marmoricola sp.]|jgi:cobyrinic acid a,c-diamide synthase|nr:cobyrinate a,c-diamide synthase [Marmoricola sp.]
MVRLPRLVIAAPSTGQGKTTIATGLMAALRAAGHEVSGHKVGPDYIDPGYHALATGRPGRNLDPHLVGEERIVPLLLHGAGDADISVIEGVMGLYDGRLGTDGFASTAQVSTLTRSPVVLVLDVARMSRTAGAIAAGMVAYDDAVDVVGVILNRVGSDRNTAEIVRSLERTGLPVLGALPHDDALATPSRHLGLVPAQERAASARTVTSLGEQVSRHLDLGALLAVAAQAPDLDEAPWDPADEVAPSGLERPVIAVAAGRAFTFRYSETEELLRAAGCDVVAFDPLHDRHLPEGTRGLYLGGGFPEMYAGELASNRSLLEDLRAAVADGTPTVAECAGLLYLAASLDGVPMAGALPADAVMTSRLTLRYPDAVAASDSLLGRVGESVTGHEFHRTTTSPSAGGQPAWVVDGEPTGFASSTLHAAYLHTHWAGHPQLAQRFADAARASAAHQASGTTAVPAARVVEDVRDPLRHHGDAEAVAGLVDFAVNVYPGERPAWLDSALHRALDDTRYPSSGAAQRALALRHGRRLSDVLPTAGAAEAFTLVARLRRWRRPVVVHPQFTEPHAALLLAGHEVTGVDCRPEDGFVLDPSRVPESADLVVIGNPTNPTGVLHPAATLQALLRPGRLVVVDEAFMDTVPGETESLAENDLAGLVVVRSLTKHWSIPGVRAGYVVGDPAYVVALAGLQTPWSVSAAALAAMIATGTAEAAAESRERASRISSWREHLEAGLRARDIEYVGSATSFVLARLGLGAREALRASGIAVRRADTFPGLDASWVRIAARPEATTRRLLNALDHLPLRQLT